MILFSINLQADSNVAFLFYSTVLNEPHFPFLSGGPWLFPRADESMKRKSKASRSLPQRLPLWVLLSEAKKEEQTVCLRCTFSSNLGVNVWDPTLGSKFFIFPPSSSHQGAF